MPDYFVLISSIFLDKIFSDFVLLFRFDSSDGATGSLWFSGDHSLHYCHIDIILWVLTIWFSLTKIVVTAFIFLFNCLLSYFYENLVQDIATFCLYSLNCWFKIYFSCFVGPWWFRSKRWWLNFSCHWTFPFEHCLSLFFPFLSHLLNLFLDNPIIWDRFTYFNSK